MLFGERRSRNLADGARGGVTMKYGLKDADYCQLCGAAKSSLKCLACGVRTCCEVTISLKATTIEEAVRELAENLASSPAFREANLELIVPGNCIAVNCVSNGLVIAHVEHHGDDELMGIVGTTNGGIEIRSCGRGHIHRIIMVTTSPRASSAYLQALAAISNRLLQLSRARPPRQPRSK